MVAAKKIPAINFDFLFMFSVDIVYSYKHQMRFLHNFSISYLLVSPSDSLVLTANRSSASHRRIED